MEGCDFDDEEKGHSLIKRLTEHQGYSNGNQQSTDGPGTESGESFDINDGDGSKRTTSKKSNDSSEDGVDTRNLHRSTETTLKRAKARFSLSQTRSARKIIWDVLDNPDSGSAAHIFDIIFPCFLSLCVLFTLSQTIEDQPIDEDTCRVVDFLIETVFALEVALRYVASPHKSTYFFKDFFNIVDMLTCLPLFFRIAVHVRGDEHLTQDNWNLCFTAIIRLVKTTRRFRKIHLLFEAFQHAFEALPVLMFIFCVINLSFSSVIFLLEDPHDSVTSLSKAIWFTTVTMTTVGFGDIVPVSNEGHLIVCCLMVTSVLYMAMPLGIIGHAFTQVWLDRDRILLVKKIKDVLREWGYTAYDIPLLFDIFDSSGECHLNITDFRKMLDQMQLGLSNKRICELFYAFDKIGQGFIEDRELVRYVFPAQYHEVYGDEVATGKSVKCKCGNVLMADAAFCRKCGRKNEIHEELTDEMIEKRDKMRARARQCPCGNLLMPDAKFCRKCGQDAGNAAEIPIAQRRSLVERQTLLRSSSSNYLNRQSSTLLSNDSRNMSVLSHDSLPQFHSVLSTASKASVYSPTTRSVRNVSVQNRPTRHSVS
jgi:Ca2+-binding EF-hand superfamily protein